MKTAPLYLLCLLCLIFPALAGAATTPINQLDSVVPTETYNNANSYTLPSIGFAVDSSTNNTGSQKSFNGYLPTGGVTADTADGTFRLSIDFDPLDTGSDHYVIWETGGSGSGFMLSYVPDTQTLWLYLRKSGVASLSYQLSTAELAAGDLDVVWTVSPTNFMTLFIDGEVVATSLITQNDWSGSEAGGYGGFSGSVAGGSLTPNKARFADLTHSAINGTIGLRYYNDLAVTMAEAGVVALTKDNLIYSWDSSTATATTWTSADPGSDLTRAWTIPSSVTLDTSNPATETDITAAYIFGSAAASSAAFNALAPDATFEVWVKPDSLSDGQQVIFESGGSTRGLALVLSDDVVHFAVKESASGPAEPDVNLTTTITSADIADYLQIVGVVDSGETRLYVNPVDESAPATAKATGIGAGSWFGSNLGGLGGGKGDTGSRSNSSSSSWKNFKKFEGRVGLARFYDIALSGEQIEQNFLYTINPPLAVSPISPFGIATGGEPFGQYPTYLPLIDQIDIVGVRGFPNWNAIEPTNDSFSWTLADDYLDTAEANGQEVSGLFAYSASWAAPTIKTFPMNNLPDWSDYVTQVVDRYKDRVTYWEVWNEPNAASFNTGNNPSEDYATLVRLAYAAAKAEDPDAKIGISIANFHVDYIRQVINALEDQGAAGSFDFIAVHPYELAGRMNAPGGEMYYLNIVPALRQMLAVHAPSKVDVPIWFTELGAKINGTIQGENVTEDLAAAQLVKVYVAGIAQGAERVAWFNVKDAGGSQGFGLMKNNFSTRKTYTAYDAVTDALGKTPEYKGWVTPDSNGWALGFVFEGNGNTTLATWMPKGESASINFGTSVEIVDITTNTSTTASSYTLTDEPVLVKGIPASMLATAEANASQPFPWSSTPVNSNLVQIDLGETTIEQGLELDRAFTVVPNGTGTNGVVVNQAGGSMYLNIVPEFMDYNSDTFYVRVTAHQEQRRKSGYSGMNLWYQNNDGNETAPPAYPYKIPSGSWRGLDNNLNTQTFTWTITNGTIVNTFGYSFYLKFDASVPFVIDKVEVSKVPF
ncbi:MAG: LamG-like jellyroll fold domain-containing protein [Verrucomicrobiota bacterium]